MPRLQYIVRKIIIIIEMYTEVYVTLNNERYNLHRPHFQQSVRFRVHRHASETKKLVRPVYRHFARKSHDFHRDHRIVPLEHCEPDALPEREAYWIRTLQTLIPHGLNSAYGKPYYPYDRSLSLSLSSTGAVPSPT